MRSSVSGRPAGESVCVATNEGVERVGDAREVGEGRQRQKVGHALEEFYGERGQLGRSLLRSFSHERARWVTVGRHFDPPPVGCWPFPSNVDPGSPTEMPVSPAEIYDSDERLCSPFAVFTRGPLHQVAGPGPCSAAGSLTSSLSQHGDRSS